MEIFTKIFVAIVLIIGGISALFINVIGGVLSILLGIYLLYRLRM